MCFIAHANHAFVWDLLDSSLGFATVASIISPTAVLLNALIIIVVKRRKELHRASNVLLSSTSCTDYLGGRYWAKYSLNVV